LLTSTEHPHAIYIRISPNTINDWIEQWLIAITIVHFHQRAYPHLDFNISPVFYSDNKNGVHIILATGFIGPLQTSS
jgi:hypothetical protein